jgi:hypothetical protein
MGPPGSASEVAVTVVPGRTAWEESRTTPRILPVFCAYTDDVSESPTIRKTAVRSLIIHLAWSDALFPIA